MAVDKLVDSTQLDADLTSVANAIRTKGGTSASLAFPAGFVSAINDIPTGGGGGGGGEDALIFIDYDGTEVASYSLTDAMALTSLPANPSHTGLTAQGWNWTLADIKSYLTDYPKATVFVGQMYITDDGKTRIYVHFEEGRSSPYLGLGVQGTVVVDWGDNSATDTLTGSSLSTAKNVQHVYTPGDYVITLTVSSGKFAFFGVANVAHILKKVTGTTANISKVYANAVKKIELGSSAGINKYAFNNCYSLESITIPSSVTSIGDNAFYYCYSLKSVTIPSSVDTINSYTFQDNRSMVNVALPNSVTHLLTYIFAYCVSLKNVTIPSGVTSIGSNAFYNCYSLKSVTIPNDVTSINSSAFYNCTALTSITLSSGLTSIGTAAFQSCNSLANITIPSRVTSIGNNAFNTCTALTSITLPSGLTSIGNSAFGTCFNLESITLPSSVTSIGGNAFQTCYSLKSINIPSGVTSIGTSAFNGDVCLASITIPSSVTSIAGQAFSSCAGLAEIHVLPTTPPTLASINVFGVQSDCIFYVPAASLTAYQTETNWSTYASQMVGE